MGGSVPSSTATQTFQAYTPNALDWANFKLAKEKQKLQMEYYRPLLEDALAKRALYKGVLQGNPESLRQFAGMPQGASQQQVMDIIQRRQGVNPNAPPPVVPKTAVQKAATGGIMQVRKFAPGGSNQKPKAPKLAPAPKNETPEQKYKRLMDFEGAGGKLNQKQKSYVANYNEYDDNAKDGGYSIDYKTGQPVPPKLPSNATKAEREAARQKFADYTGLDLNAKGKVIPGTGTLNIPKAADPNAPAPDTSTPDKPYSELGSTPGTYGVVGNPNDPTQPITYTDPWVNNMLNTYNQMQAPAEFGQASGYYNTAAQGLQSLAGYTPQQVTAQQATAQNAAAQQASAAQMGQIANISAERAAAERAAATQMGAIGDVNAQQVDLGKYNVSASQMQRPEDVTAKELQRYQMEGTTPVTTQALEAYQMEGPGSWTDEGVSSKYMSPYMQGVIDISKREAERDYTKQMNALNAKAMSAGAFGGARQAMERSEAQRNYNQQLQDLQVKGLQQAYESGRSQYGQELSLSQQAALNNLQSKLSTQSQSSQEALQAMLSNQNIDYQTKLQNLQAMLGVQSQEAQQMLNASLANQQAEMVTGQTNAQLAQQAALANQGANVQGSLANQQAALQAALANQQTQFGVGQFNAAAQNQASLQNASLGTQANLANQQAALQAALANQQTQFGVGSLNANLANQVALQNASLGTQASLQNAQLGTQTSWQNANNALQASMANQQAGLQGNAQNIAAYGAMGNMASGLGSIGQYNANFNQQYLGNLGQLYNTTQGLQQSYLDKQQQNAINQQLGASNIDKYIAPGTAGGLMGNIGQNTQNLQ